MTKASLVPEQRTAVEIIEALGHGVIERLHVRGGLPCYEPEPHIVQKVNLGSGSEQSRDHYNDSSTLKIEFENLFRELIRLRDGTVDIEVRHSIPIRIVLRHSCKEILS